MKKMPRVILASRTFAPEPTAAALRLSALAQALVTAGCEVHVLTSQLDAHTARSGEPVDAPSLRVDRWPVLRDKTGAVRGYIPYLSFDIPLFFRLLFTQRPDVVINEAPPTTGVMTRLACSLRRLPYVYYAADIVSDAAKAQNTHPLVLSAVRFMERFAMSKATKVIAVSDGVAQRVKDIAGREADIVPNGIDTSLGQDADLSPAPADFPENSHHVFLYAGTVAPWLAPEVFIDAIDIVRRTFPDATLVFLGQGSSWEELKERAGGKEYVSFHPPVSASDAAHWFTHATASLASLKPGVYDYAYPTKILSSLAAGTPVVYAGPGQAAEDIRSNQLGEAVTLDAHEVAQAMIRLARTPDSTRDELRSHLREWVQQNRSVAHSSRCAAQLVISACTQATA